MTWDILILTMDTRTAFLSRLMRFLYPQIVPGVVARIKLCDPNMSLGENRDIMRKASSADYISFVDDDDLVAPDYVASILPLLDGVDQIGFECELWIDGVKDPKRDIHSLREPGWFETETYYNRDISHLQPMRRSLALLAPMEGGHGEDRRWSDRMRGKVKTEHYIDRVMYYYLFRSNKNRGAKCPKCASLSTVRVEIGTHCNACGHEFNPEQERKSCLWI